MVSICSSRTALLCTAAYFGILSACSSPARDTAKPAVQEPTRLDNLTGTAEPAADQTSFEPSATPDPDNPDPDNLETWIARLENPEQVAQAIKRLQRLKMTRGIEAALEPLARVWQRENRPRKILVVIVDLAETGAGGPHWSRVVPVLRTALDDYDVSDPGAVENAIVAADALGRTSDKSAVPILIRALNKNMPKLSMAQRVRLAASTSLGQYSDDPRAVSALIGILSQAPGNVPAPLLAVSALALAESRSPDAIEPLILTLFSSPALFSYCRRALINNGKPALTRLLAVFQGKDRVLETFARARQFNVRCKRAMGPDTDCRAPGNLQYKSALLIGDFYSAQAVKPLLAGLARPPVPAYYQHGVAGPTQHTAILSALRNIGAPEAAARVWRYASARKTDDGIRPLAIDTYSFLETGTGKLRALARFIKDDKEDEPTRLAAGVAYGRLARSKNAYRPLVYMIDRYRKEADKNAADARAQAAAGDREAASMAESRASGYRGFQRTFEYNLARAHVGVTCKRDPGCFTRMIDIEAEELAASMIEAGYLPDWDRWSKPEKSSLRSAAVERALIELRKLGPAASAVTDQLLEHADSTDRVVRQGVLQALVKVAPLPCDRCVARLGQVVEAQKDQSLLAALNVETQAVRGYFLWAGR